MATMTDEQQAAAVEDVLAGNTQCRICLIFERGMDYVFVSSAEPDLPAWAKPSSRSWRWYELHLCKECHKSWSAFCTANVGNWWEWKARRKAEVGRC